VVVVIVIAVLLLTPSKRKEKPSVGNKPPASAPASATSGAGGIAGIKAAAPLPKLGGTKSNISAEQNSLHALFQAAGLPNPRVQGAAGVYSSRLGRHRHTD
jgi:hypothetical protein